MAIVQTGATGTDRAIVICDGAGGIVTDVTKMYYTTWQTQTDQHCVIFARLVGPCQNAKRATQATLAHIAPRVRNTCSGMSW